jgi:hypothetical protein
MLDFDICSNLIFLENMSYDSENIQFIFSVLPAGGD